MTPPGLKWPFPARLRGVFLPAHGGPVTRGAPLTTLRVVLSQRRAGGAFISLHASTPCGAARHPFQRIR